MSIDTTQFSKEKANEAIQKMNAMSPTSEEDACTKIAAANDTTVQELLARPDFKELWNNFHKKIAEDFIALLEKDYGLTNVQAWAFFAFLIGLFG